MNQQIIATLKNALLTQQREATKPVKALAGWIRKQAGISPTREEKEALEEYQHRVDNFTFALPIQNATWTRASVGSHMVPTTIEGFVEELKSASGVYENATVYRSATMENVVIPILDDTANDGILLTGDLNMNSTVEPSVGSLQLGQKTISSAPITVSVPLLKDAGFDVERYILEAAAKRIGRKFNDLATNGSGSSGEPTGLVTQAPVGIETASSSAFTYDELLALVFAVDPEVHQVAKFMLHPATLKVILALKDSNGQPIVYRDPLGQVPMKLFGFPVVLNSSMPQIAAGNKVIVFGDLSRYVVRERNELTIHVLKETYLSKNAVGFLVNYDFDCGPAFTSTTKTVAALKMKSST